jgi:hypothetical protein
MSEYLTYTLWRNREERMPHELERRRAAQERLEQDQGQLEQAQEQLLGDHTHEQLLAEHRPVSARELPGAAEAGDPTGALGTLPESAAPSTASAGARDGSLVPTAASPVSSEATDELEHQLVER